MAKKFFDILPPKPPAEKPKPFFEKAIPPLISENKKWWGITEKVVGGVLVFLILVGISCYFLLSKAEIEIWPKTEILNFGEKVTADSKTENIDLLSKIIPAKLFEKELTLSEEFPASGKKEKRAEGILRVYNAYSTSPQVLVATTRFISADGKLFRSIEKVTIPGGKYEGVKFVPGYLDIKIRADQPGAEYDIGPSTFAIPGFAGTSKYTAFYGKSFEKMSGGGIVSEVKEDDLAKAKKVLVEKTLKDCQASLKAEIPSDFIFLEKSLSQELIESTSSTKAGEEVQSFNFQVKVKSRLISFKESDLERLVKSLIVSQLPEEKKLLVESLKINRENEIADLKSEKIIFDLAITAKIYLDIDEVSLKKGLLGKSLAETQIILENQPQITKFLVKFWPFWVKKVPENTEKIKIKITVD